MPKERRTELSAASVALMLLVVFIHSAAECVNGYDPMTFAYAAAGSLHRLASFAVQGFLFLAGLKLTLRRPSVFSTGRYLRGRLSRIGLPYLVAFAAFLAVYLLTGRLNDPSPVRILAEFFTGGLTGHFYFVAVMAQFCLLVPLWNLLERRAHPALTLFVSLILTLVFMDHMPELVRLATGFRVELTRNAALFTSYLFYWIAGMTAGANYDGFRGFLRARRTSLTVLWILSAVGDIALFLAIKRGIYYALWADDFHLMTCTLAILALLSHAAALADSDVPFLRSALFADADRASYLVYLWHPMAILLIDSLMNRLGIGSRALRCLIRFPAALFLTLALSILWQKLYASIRSRLTNRNPAKGEP